MSEPIPCPWCAEDIKPSAKICRHCKSDLTKPVEPEKPGAAARKAVNSGCTGCLSLFCFFFILALIFPSTNDSRSSASRPPARSAPTTYSVVYSVGGTASSASLTYQNKSGGTDQKKVSLPWTYSFNGKPGDFLYLSAQNEKEYGTVTAEIKLNGTTVQSAESNDGYGIASVSGSI